MTGGGLSKGLAKERGKLERGESDAASAAGATINERS